MPAPFSPGDLILLLDGEGNQHLVRLSEGGSLHHHLGRVSHEEIIGLQEGEAVRSGQGAQFVVVRPRLVDYVFGMPRRSGIVYPKDAAQIITWADIGPGMRVFESGIGSGALTLALLRAVGERGQVVAYEQRADFISLALSNVRAFASAEAGNLLVRERDVFEGVADGPFDRVVLDLPEPWRLIDSLPDHLVQGGWVCAYTPSIVQVQQMVEALKASERFLQIETQEVLLRTWHVEGQAVRPEQQMVGHTGFMTFARFVAPQAGSRRILLRKRVRRAKPVI